MPAAQLNCCVRLKSWRRGLGIDLHAWHDNKHQRRESENGKGQDAERENPVHAATTGCVMGAEETAAGRR